MQEDRTQAETMWSKGHPEKYKKRRDWAVYDFMNDRVYKLAETQYGRTKPRGQGLTYSHGPSWEIEHMRTVLRGNWKKRLKIVGMQERLEHFLRRKLQNRRDRLAKEEDQQMEEQKGEARGVMGGDLGNGCEGEEDEEGDLVDRVVGSWMDRDMVKGFVTTNRDLFLTRMKVRVITAGLATQARFGRQTAEDGDKLCRRCGKQTGKPETNWHVLWECTHPAVVKQRHRLQQGREQLLEKGGLKRSGLVVAMAGRERGWHEVGWVGRGGVISKDDGRDGARSGGSAGESHDGTRWDGFGSGQEEID